MKIGGRVCLSDLRSISQQEFNTACRICREIKEIQESRAAYIEKRALDPEIALPAAFWGENGQSAIHDLYRLVATPTYNVINRLRFFTQPFTGFQLISFSRGYGKTPIPEIPDNFDEEIRKIAPAPDHWVRRYLLITRHLPIEMIARPPKILGEIGWDVGGSPVNHDTFAYQERLNLLFEAGIINWLRKKVETSGSVNILEIGGGYGGLAYHLKHIVTQTNYFICDIPEALLFSSLYLAIAQPEYSHTIYDGTDKNRSILCRSDFGFKFVPNFMFDDLVVANVKIDLAINTISFAEMSQKQVHYYAQRLKNMLNDTGVLFEQNPDFVGLPPKKCLPNYFMFRENIKPNSVPVLEHGVPDVWANRRISDIIDAEFKPFGVQFKPFGGPVWKIYWMIENVVLNRGMHWRSIKAQFLEAVKKLTKKLIGPRMYGVLKGWWDSLKRSKRPF